MEEKIKDALPEKAKALSEAMMGDSVLTVEESVRNMHENIKSVSPEEAKGLSEALLGKHALAQPAGEEQNFRESNCDDFEAEQAAIPAPAKPIFGPSRPLHML